jgi:shikimate kinase
MRLSLIGMSGCGKTHWSREFATHGFRLFCCDDLISEKLLSLLERPDGTVMEMGAWMGLPYEHHYADREAKYLAHEINVLTEILDYLERLGQDRKEKVIVDTTGSVIYTGQDILERLREKTTVVHLETPPTVQEIMLQKYLKNHRPVLWRGLFRRKAGETNNEALARCYPTLLSSREAQYRRHAHLTIDYDVRNHDSFTIEDFIDMVNAA